MILTKNFLFHSHDNAKNTNLLSDFFHPIFTLINFLSASLAFELFFVKNLIYSSKLLAVLLFLFIIPVNIKITSGSFYWMVSIFAITFSSLWFFFTFTSLYMSCVFLILALIWSLRFPRDWSPYWGKFVSYLVNCIGFVS